MDLSQLKPATRHDLGQGITQWSGSANNIHAHCITGSSKQLYVLPEAQSGPGRRWTVQTSLVDAQGFAHAVASQCY